MIKQPNKIKNKKSNSFLKENQINLNLSVYEVTYPPLSVGVSPNREQKLTDMRRDATTVTTADRASPHLDFTISIFPVIKGKYMSEL